MSLYVTPTLPDELYHFGIKGQKWGVRRYQNEDGTWTAAGKERYGRGSKNKESTKSHADRFKEKYNSIGESMRRERMNLESKRNNYIDSEIKKRTGYSKKEAYEKAREQSRDINSGKLKYEDSLWARISDIENESYRKFSNIDYAKYNEKISKEAEKFLDSYFENHDALTLKDLYDQIGDDGVDIVDDLLTRIEYESKKYRIDSDFTIRR